jgi:hypothetical protein
MKRHILNFVKFAGYFIVFFIIGGILSVIGGFTLNTTDDVSKKLSSALIMLVR